MIVNQQAGTRVDEVAAGIYRISTPLDVIPGGFYLQLLSGRGRRASIIPYRLAKPLCLDIRGPHEGDAGRETTLDWWIAL